MIHSHLGIKQWHCCFQCSDQFYPSNWELKSENPGLTAKSVFPVLDSGLLAALIIPAPQCFPAGPLQPLWRCQAGQWASGRARRARRSLDWWGLGWSPPRSRPFGPELKRENIKMNRKNQELIGYVSSTTPFSLGVGVTFSDLCLYIRGVIYLLFVVLVTYFPVPLSSSFLPLHLQLEWTSRHDACTMKKCMMRWKKHQWYHRAYDNDGMLPHALIS